MLSPTYPSQLRPPWAIAAVALLLMGSAALLLTRFQLGRHLGKPGVRVVNTALNDDHGKLAATNSILLPETPLDYRSILLPVTREELDWLPRDTTFGRRLYTAPDGFRIQVSGVLMGTDRTSIHKPEFCLPGQGFQILRRDQTHIVIDRPHRYALPVTRLNGLREMRKPDGTVERVGAVYVYWFLSDSRLSNDHAQRMWWLATDLLRTGELQRWAYLSTLAVCPPGQEDATYARLERLIQTIVPEIQQTTGPQLATTTTAQAPPP